MSLNNLRPPKGAQRGKKRVGRGPGSGHGKTASRGSKGAKSRSGFRFKEMVVSLMKWTEFPPPSQKE